MSLRKLIASLEFTTAEWSSAVRGAFKSQPSRFEHNPAIVQLEARTLYSAAPMPVDAIEGISEDGSEELSAQSTALAEPVLVEEAEASTAAAAHSTEQAQEHHELVLVDTSADNYQQLIDDIVAQQFDGRRVDVRLLDADEDGIDQISTILAEYQDLNAIHIVSHGSEGAVRFGSTWLSSDSLAGYVGDVVGWQDALAADADMLIYGCDLASTAEGRTLIDMLAMVCDCDVAASDDLTGHDALSGDWVLEYTTGVIDVGIAFSQELQQNWGYLLDIATFQQGVDSYTGTEDTGLDENAPDTTHGGQTSNAVDLNTPGTEQQALIQFANLFGSGPGQIPIGSTINSASLTVEATGASDAAAQITLHRMLTNWDENATWNSLTGGVSNDGIEAVVAADSTLPSPDVNGTKTFSGLASTLQLWSDGTANHGWVILSDSANGWDFHSSETGTASNRPILTVDYTAPAAPHDLEATASSGGLSLNENGGNDAYLVADSGFANALSSFTFEMQFEANSFAGDTPFVSYNTGAGDELTINTLNGTNALELDFGTGTTVETTTIDYIAALIDGDRHTLSVTWDNTAGDWEVYIDGISVDSGTGLATGATIQTGGTLLFGLEQDAVGGGFDPNQYFGGTIYDARFFDDVRTTAEIVAYQDTTLPYDHQGMIANWQFDTLSTDGVVTEAVSGNNLTLQDAGGAGFTRGNSDLALRVDEWAANGTVVGTITGTDAQREDRIATLLAADPDLIYSAETGKFYKAIASSVNWSTAKTNAESTTLNGVNGQLGTIRSAAENEIITNAAAVIGGSVWLGGTDATVEGEWRWINAGSESDLFWTGAASGVSPHGVYSNWLSGSEPSAGAGQNAARLDSTSGKWSDAPPTASNHNYIIEWDADSVLDATDVLTYTIQSQTVAGAFTIDADSGEITVADGSLLDFDSNPTHTITVRVTDGDTNTYDEAFTVDLNNVDRPPVISIPAPESMNEDTTLTYSTGNGNLISISDEAGETPYVTLSVTNGTLTVSGAGSATITGDGTALVTLSGTVADINLALDGLVYDSNNDWNGAETLTITALDGDIRTLNADVNLEGYYEFNSAAPGADSSPSGAGGGTILGGASVVSDPIRADVLSLDGIDDGVQISGLMGSPADVTLAAWVNMDSGVSDGELISLGDYVGIRIDEPTSGIRAFFNDGGTWHNLDSGLFIAGTGWHHVAYTFDDTSDAQTLYLDGIAVATGSRPESIAYTGQGSDTYIGRHGNAASNYLKGSVDDVRVLSRALSAAEIAGIVSAPDMTISSSLGITVTPVNDSPINTVPGAQNVDEDIALVFSSGNGNSIAVSDDSGNKPIEVTLTATNGTITLSTVERLIFSAGTGSGDATMTFIGTQADINAALEGMAFLGDPGFSGAADITITTSDLGSEVAGNETVMGTSASLGTHDKEQLATQFAVTQNGTVDSVTAYLYVDKPQIVRYGIYSDVAGEPGLLLVESVATLDAGTGWYTIAFPATALTAGDYWIAWAPGKEAAHYYDASGGSTRFSNYDPNAGLASNWTGTYESNSYNVSIFASFTPDGASALSDVDVVNINVGAVNNAPAVATNTGTTVNEGSSGNTITTSMLNEGDPDDSGAGLVYTVTNVTDNGTLNLAGFGALGLNDTFTQADIDAGDVTYTHNGSETTSDAFEFSLADGGENGSTPATGTFNIAVTLTNDNSITAITDTDASSNLVLENSTIGTTVGVTAFADDADAGDTVTYSLDDNDGGRFAIDTNTGVVSVAGAINRETDGPTRSITVRATSTDTSSTTQNFVITIADVDEFDVGAVTDTDATTNAVNENATVGALVGIDASASDDDATNNGITYSLFDSDGGRFAINSSSGVVTVSGAINRETDGASRNITVRATSADGSFTDQLFSIAINDVDEFNVGPVTDTDVAANEVSESAANGTAVGITASASDTDATDNITYSLDDSAGGRFAIDASTGVITVANSGLLDYETTTSHSVTVRATSDDSSFATGVMVINLLDETNENAAGPISDSDPTLDSIAENATLGTAVGITGFASDADVGDTISYSLDDDAGGRFAIDANTGVVTLAGSIDAEAANSHNITVRATSSDTSFSTAVFTVAVGDVDEFDISVLTDNDAAANVVNENAVNGSTTGITAFASDADADNNTISYSLIDDDAGRFAIDANSGVVTVAGAIDREADGMTRNITVRATSADGSTSDRVFSIQVNDVDEFDTSPITDSDSSENIFSEFDPNGATVGFAALASDGDATNNAIVYSLDDDAGGRFAIDGLTGQVTLADQSLIDFFSAASHTVVIRATSADGSSQTGSFTIAVEEVPLAPPSSPTPSPKPQSEPEPTQNQPTQESQETPSEPIPLVETPKTPTQAAANSSSEVQPVKQPAAGIFVIAADGLLNDSDDEQSIDEDDLLFANNTLDEAVRAAARRLAEATISNSSLRYFTPLADTVLSLAFDQQNNWDYQQSWEKEKEVRELVVGTSAVISGSLSVGYVYWLLRGGSLAASVFSALPAWCSFDPLPIVDSFENANASRKRALVGESLSNIVRPD